MQPIVLYKKQKLISVHSEFDKAMSDGWKRLAAYVCVIYSHLFFHMNDY